MALQASFISGRGSVPGCERLQHVRPFPWVLYRDSRALRPSLLDLLGLLIIWECHGGQYRNRDRKEVGVVIGPAALASTCLHP